MKKLITNNKFIQKIFLSIIIVLLFNFAMPTNSQADFGGILLDPVVDFLATILDTITGGLQSFLIDGEFNNSEDSAGLLNSFLADKESFSAKVDGVYKEFKYSPEDGEPTVEVHASELDKSFWTGKSNYAIPVLKYTPDKIFSGLIPALDINFVNPKDWKAEGYENGAAMNKRSIASELHSTIASWYVSLRNLAAVGLMLVLVYVGIRMVISSTASDKAKYKQMLMDWIVALCLLFCLHYIMTFTITIVNEISTTISGVDEGNNGNNIRVRVYNDNGNSANNVTPGGNDYTGGPEETEKNICSKCR